jgi:NodT family efflux transporter outer membrane factor (OMF) lipoprotein
MSTRSSNRHCIEPGRFILGTTQWTLLACAIGLLPGCISAPQQCDAPLAFETPANWSSNLPAVVAPKPTLPPVSPASWPTPSPVTSPVTSRSAAPPASTLASWWLRFDDPLLVRLVDQALVANSSVKIAQGALQQARAQRDVAAAALWPVLGASASAQHNTVGRQDSSNSFRVGLDASWELDLFGVNRSGLNASEAGALASAAGLGEVQITVAAEVALNYLALRGGQARLAIAEANLASQIETLQITEWRLQAGLVASLDAEQARAQAEQTRAQLPALRTGIDNGSHALAVLIGQPPAALAATLAVIAPIPSASADLALSIPAETLRQRPDVRAAEYQVNAALARVSQANAARAPNFRLGGSLGLNALTVGALGHGASLLSSVLASIAMPLFDGGALRAQVRAQQAALVQARGSYQATVLLALQEVEDALVALRGDRERLLHLQAAAEAAGNAALMAQQRYGSGLVDFQVVLETQRTQLNTQDGVAGARADLGADHVRLYKALGGGWNANLDDAAPTGPRISRL